MPTALRPSFEERRQIRRARVRMRARVRPGEFDDGYFEEIGTTLDASRKAFYFHTTLSRYRQGMQLRVIFPYDPGLGSGQEDDPAQVVRVEPEGDGFGIAVVFWRRGTLRPAELFSEPSQVEVRRDGDRRAHPRHSLMAAAEVVDTPTGMRLRASTSDVSLGGCYINTLNPFPLGTPLLLKIEHGNASFEAEAFVSTRHEGMGMGLAFKHVSAEQKSRLAKWIPESDAAMAGSTN
ncbi:MAG: PilZ domain-containing protein [Candidatus Acidiferrales bacterium]